VFIFVSVFINVKAQTLKTELSKMNNGPYGKCVIWDDREQTPFVCIDATSGKYLSLPNGILYGSRIGGHPYQARFDKWATKHPRLLAAATWAVIATVIIGYGVFCITHTPPPDPPLSEQALQVEEQLGSLSADEQGRVVTDWQNQQPADDDDEDYRNNGA
jgi:hypothetical protein